MVEGVSLAQSKWRWNALPVVLPVQIPIGQIIKSRTFLIAAVGYLAVLLLMFWPLFRGDVLSSGAQTRLAPPFVDNDSIEAIPHVNSWTGDFVEQFSVFEEYQYRAAREGRFPTWNPHIFMGHPFHADGQSAMLDPFDWVYFWVDPNVARGPMTILRLGISALALFALLRKFSLAPTACFAGGAIWILGSFNMHWLLWPQTNASLWVPVMLLALDYLLVKPGWRGYAVASLLSAPLFLSGHPGTEYLCGLLIGFYVLIRLFWLALDGLTLRQLLTATGIAAGAVITGVLVAAAALLPLYMQIRHSYEYLDPSGERGTMTKLSGHILWLFLMPEFFGRPRGAFPGFIYDGPDNYIEASLWFGAIGLVLALAVLIATLVPRSGNGKWRDHFSFLPVFAILAFVLSLMVVFCIWPVYPLVANAPGMALTSARRLYVAVQFSGAILAALALDQILVRRDRLTVSIAGGLAVTACGMVVTQLYRRWDGLLESWGKSLAAVPAQLGPNWTRVVPYMIEQFAGFRMMLGGILLVISTAVLLCILVVTFQRRTVSPTLRYLLAIMITLDVMLPAYDFNPVTPAKLVVPPNPEVLESMILQAGDGRMLGVNWMLDPDISMHYGFRDIRGYDLPHSLRLSKLFKTLEIEKFDNRGLMDFGRFYPYIRSHMAAYLDRTCVRALMVFVPDPKAAESLSSLSLSTSFEAPGFMKWPQTSATRGMLVFTNPNSYPRTYLTKTAAPLTSPDDAMNALLDATTDLRDRSVYEGSSSNHTAAPAADAPDDASLILTDKPERVVIDTRTASERLLVLADRMDDGWQVTVDGNPAEALTANYLFRGVFVPAGHHSVEWTYHAPGLVTGVTISIISVIALLGLLITTSIGSQRSYEEPTAPQPSPSAEPSPASVVS